MEQTVRKAFDVLEALAKSDEPRRLTDLARELTLTKPNVYRLLSTLSQLGYVAKEESTSRYSATLKLWQVGAEHVHDATLVTRTQPMLKDLAESTKHSVDLAVYDQGYALLVNRFDVPQSVKAGTTIKSRMPAAATSAGKAMLAWKDESDVKQAMSLMKRFTATSRTSLADLGKDLEDVRELGFAVNHGEWREGVGGIAAPIRDESGDVIASVGVWGPEATLLGARKEEIGELVMSAAKNASRDMGFSGR